MRQINPVFLLVLLFGSLTDFSIRPLVLDPDPAPIKIIFSNDIRGKLDPCGCDLASSFGGLGRRYQYIQDEFLDVQIFVDAGNILFEDPAEWKENYRHDLRAQEDAIRAFTIAEYLSQFQNITAINVGHTDLGFGSDFLQSLELPFISANLLDYERRQIFPAYITTGEFIFWGITRPLTDRSDFTFKPFEAIIAEVQNHTNKVNVLLTDLNKDDVLYLEPYFDVIVWSRINDPDVQNLHLKNKIVSAKLQGRDLGIITYLQNTFEVEFRPLSSQIASSSEVFQLIQTANNKILQLNSKGILNFALDAYLLNDPFIPKKKFYAEIAQNNLVALDSRLTQSQKQLLQKQIRYVSFEKLIKENVDNLSHYYSLISENQKIQDMLNQILLPPARLSRFEYSASLSCMRCHQGIYSLWQKTKHSQAFQVLIQDKKAMYSECVACHTTGYRQQGGPIRPQDFNQVPSLHNVGCESCHGSGRKHILNPYEHEMLRGDNEAMCRSCHKVEHSAAFDNNWKYTISCIRSSYPSDPEKILYATCTNSGCHLIPEKWSDREAIAKMKKYGMVDVAITPMSFSEFTTILHYGKNGMPAFPHFAKDKTLMQKLYTYIRRYWHNNKDALETGNE